MCNYAVVTNISMSKWCDPTDSVEASVKLLWPALAQLTSDMVRSLPGFLLTASYFTVHTVHTVHTAVPVVVTTLCVYDGLTVTTLHGCTVIMRQCTVCVQDNNTE